MAIPLSQGAILRAFQGKEDQSKPILQVIDVKKIQSAQQGQQTRYRLILSDGVNYLQATLTTQLNALVDQGKLTQYCIVEVGEHICNTVTSRKILIILKMRVLDPGPGELIGQPTNVEQAGGGDDDFKLPAPAGRAAAPAGRGRGAPVAAFDRKKAPQSFGGAPTFHPISSLNPYQNRWTIKARVTAKSDIRTFNNARGEGKLFSVDLLDQQGGQIRATMFGDACDAFYPIFQQDKVYIISKGNLKLANQKFSRLPNEYEITLNADAEVEYVEDDDSIEKQKFEFCPIDRLKTVEENEFVDLIGVVTACSSLSNLTSKKTQKELTKRVVTITDQSLVSVDLTLWGKQAEQYNEQELANNPIIAIKMCRVSNFGGKTLSTTFGSQIFINPELPESFQLRSWYDSQGKTATFDSISNERTGGGGSDGQKRKPLSCIKDEKLGFDKPAYFSSRATVTFFRHDPAKPPWYNACPSEKCNRKVTPKGDEGFFCEKCAMTYPNYRPRYILSLLVCDHSGSTWLTAFDDTAKLLLNGITAQELEHIHAKSKDDQVTPNAEFNQVFDQNNFKQYVFRLRAKAENVNDEMRVRGHVIKVEPLNFVKESQALLEEIARYS